MTTAPERIWAWAWQTVPMGQWGITPSPSSVEYIRADIAAVQPAQDEQCPACGTLHPVTDRVCPDCKAEYLSRPVPDQTAALDNLIPLEAAIAALDKHAHGTTTLGGQTHRTITLDVAIEALRDLQTDRQRLITEAVARTWLAAAGVANRMLVREAALREAAAVAECDGCDHTATLILALIDKGAG